VNLGLTSLELAGLVLSAELAVVACGLPAVLLTRMRRRSSAAVAGAQRMLDTVDRSVPDRREALGQVFASAYQLEGAALAERVEEFVEREQAFYRAMTQVYLDRDNHGLEEIPAELAAVMAPWIDLATVSAAAVPERDSLAAENATLCAELDRTREHLESLLREYAKAFRAKETSAESELPAAATAVIDVSADDEVGVPLDGEEDEAAELARLLDAEVDGAGDTRSEDEAA